MTKSYEEFLVPPTKYSARIKCLPFYKRIDINLPILVRESVAKRLANAADSLPKNFFLQVDSGFRSIEVQKTLWDHRVKQLGLEKTKKLVGNPDFGIPSHTTGGAIDVSLLDVNLNEINLSEPFIKYYEEQKLYSKKITKRAQRLRLLLKNVIATAGFAPHDSEYWHFSYGDSQWAKYYQKKVLYKEVRLVEKYYYPFLQRFFIKLVRKLYKLINKVFNINTNY